VPIEITDDKISSENTIKKICMWNSIKFKIDLAEISCEEMNGIKLHPHGTQ